MKVKVMIKKSKLNLTIRARKSFQVDHISCLAFTLLSFRQSIARSRGFFLSLALAPQQGELKTVECSLIKRSLRSLSLDFMIPGRKPLALLKNFCGGVI